MHLKRLAVDDVKNLVGVRFEPHPRLNVFVGDNGQGKTNLLEAIHLAAALRPLRSVERAADLVRFGKERGTISARFEVDGPLDVDVVVEPKGRRASIADKRVQDVSEVAQKIGVVAFVPEDAAIVRGGPAERRRALDRFAFGLMPTFAKIARRYESALERRNRLLRQGTADDALLGSYTALLVETGVELVRARTTAAAAWSPLFSIAAREVASLDASIRYASTLGGDEDVRAEGEPGTIARRFEDALLRAADQERRRGTTAVGPHLDDVIVAKDDKKARWLASQGEARAIVLALKIAAVRATTKARGAAPLFLLDDVAGELDPDKAKHLFAVVDEVGSQTFVTTTHEGALPPLGARRVAFIRAGGIFEVRDRAPSAAI